MTSIGIRTVSLLMAVYGLYCVLIAWIEEDSLNVSWTLWYTVWGSFAFVGGIFLFLEKSWSQFVVYVVVSVNTGVLVYLTVVGVQNGPWPYDSLLSTVIAFAPGTIFILVCLASCYVVGVHFRGQKADIPRNQ